MSSSRHPMHSHHAHGKKTHRSSSPKKVPSTCAHAIPARERIVQLQSLVSPLHSPLHTNYTDSCDVGQVRQGDCCVALNREHGIVRHSHHPLSCCVSGNPRVPDHVPPFPLPLSLIMAKAHECANLGGFQKRKPFVALIGFIFLKLIQSTGSTEFFIPNSRQYHTLVNRQHVISPKLTH
jgi:hypothetical protein